MKKVKNKKWVECLNDQRKNTTRSYLSRGLLFLSILIIYNIKEQLLIDYNNKEDEWHNDREK